MNGRRFAGLIITAIAVVGAAASLAWACTGAQATLSIVPRSAAVGEPVSVVSEGFAPSTPLEIRWNSADGPVIGTSNGRDRAVSVDIPSDATPGFYYLVMMDPISGTKVGADSFELLSGSASPAGGQGEAVSPDLWAGFRSSGADLGTSMNGRPADSASPGLVLGVTMIGVSILSVFAGLAATSSRRRRQPVR